MRNHAGLVDGLPEHVHLLGAGGAGLSGAARVLLARGHKLSGHDREASGFTQALEALGIPITLGPSLAESLPLSASAIVRSAAIPEEDPQLQRARSLGWVECKYAELLGRLAPPARTLAVAGTHGKTTSSWMLHHALVGLGQVLPALGRPGALVGGVDGTLETNAVVPGEGGWFVTEACEYDRSFLHLRPFSAMVTNVEADHLDCYGTGEAVEAAFASFVDGLPTKGLLVLGREAPACVESATQAEVWRLGRELRVELGDATRGCFEFRLRGLGWRTPPIQLKVPGEFNVENAALAVALAVGTLTRVHGQDPERCAIAAAEGMASFTGAQRRFEPWGTALGLDLIHDYAHHPTEVEATLKAARRVFPGAPLHVLFQPHQYSRTAHFLDQFVEALTGADRVVVADVYGARQPIDGVMAGAVELVELLLAAGVDAVHGGESHQAAEAFAEQLGFETAGLVLGAGDIDGIKDDLLSRLALRCSSTR